MISRILGWGTSLLVLLIILELGLRLLVPQPPARIVEHDPTLGWRNVPDATFRRSDREFDVEFTFNDIGLRDDPITVDRAPGERRILMIGDSFVLGYTVDREDHFVDLLEDRLNASASSGSSYQVINAGVEGYSNDQEVLLLQRLQQGETRLVRGNEGGPTRRDTVILCMYVNDLYWNDQSDQMGAPKPRLEGTDPNDPRSAVKLSVDPPLPKKTRSWFQRNSAIARLFGSSMQAPKKTVEGVGEIYAENGFFLSSPVPDYVTAALNKTVGILRAFRTYCESAGLNYCVALIPHKAQVNPQLRDGFSRGLPAGGSWDVQRATSTMAQACEQAGIDGLHLLDPMKPGAGEKLVFEESGEPLYYQYDWHFNPLGNVRFAEALAQRMRASEFYPDLGVEFTLKVPEKEARAAGIPTWVFVIAGLWILLTVGFIYTYPDENKLLAPLKIGALLLTVLLIFFGIGKLAGGLPVSIATYIPLVFVGLILLVVLWGVRKRIGTIFELFSGMIDRGHWYMVPLLTVLLTIGMLLVVAASNPFVAPFIYTLF